MCHAFATLGVTVAQDNVIVHSMLELGTSIYAAR